MIYGNNISNKNSRLYYSIQQLSLNPIQTAYASIILVVSIIILLMLDILSTNIQSCSKSVNDSKETSFIHALAFPSISNSKILFDKLNTPRNLFQPLYK